MTSFEKTTLSQISAAGIIGSAALFFGPDPVKFVVVPACCGWAGAATMSSQSTDRDGYPKKIEEPDDLGNSLLLPMMTGIAGVLFASLAGAPIAVLAFLLHQI